MRILVQIRALISIMLLSPALLVGSGCANVRLPAIDPSGRRIFLPNPNYTTLARDAPLSRLLHRDSVASGAIAPGPYEPALLNRHRGQLLAGLREHGRNLATGLHNGVRGLGAGLAGHHTRNANAPSSSAFGNNSQFNAPVFQRVPEPPACGPDGRPPDGAPCYPIGSPSPTSLTATLPPLASRVGSGLQGTAPASQTAAPLSNQQQALGHLVDLGPRVVLAKSKISARVGEEVVVVGGIQSSSGVSRPGEPVRWQLANNSAGTIVDAEQVAEPRSRWFGLKRTGAPDGGDCGNCVRSLTSTRCRVLKRNPIDPADDVYLSRGQTWVSLTSGSEGKSYVTLSAPQLERCRQATAVVDWIDATWDCPKPVLTSMEGPGRLVTYICKNSNKRPLENWIVRHTVLDGPTARLGNSDDDQRVDVRTDSLGRSVLDVFPISTEPGTTRIGIQIIDPERPAEPLGQCIGYVTWSSSVGVGPPPDLPVAPPRASDLPSGDAPPFEGPPEFDQQPPKEQPEPESAQLAIAVTNVPPAVVVGNEINYRISVRNKSQAFAERVIVSTSIPTAALRFNNSDIRPEQRGNQLAWQLGRIAPGQNAVINTSFLSIDVGELNQVFFVVAENASEVSDNALTDITPIPLTLGISAAEPFDPRVGQETVHRLAVENQTERLIEADLIVYGWTPGLEPLGIEPGKPVDPNRGVSRIVSIRPGVNDPFDEVRFRTTQPGTQEFRVKLQDRRSGVTVEELGTVLVSEVPKEAKLEIAITGDRQIQAGNTASLQIIFKNTGNVPLSQAQVTFYGDSDLVPVNATGGFESRDEGVLVWPIAGEIPPGYGQTIDIQLQAVAQPLQTQAQLKARVDTSAGFGEQDFTINIVENRANYRGENRRSSLRPMTPASSALSAAIVAFPQTVRVGEPLEFVVTVRNDNPRGYRDLQLTMEIAEDMEFIGVSGPPATRSTIAADGLRLEFSSIREILPKETLTFKVKATADRPGVAKLLARAEAKGLAQPLVMVGEANVN